ncbi:MAG: DUF4136 domain-containing protein [Gammaproteobacteria bacterium]|jgi:hypothetical protein
MRIPRLVSLFLLLALLAACAPRVMTEHDPQARFGNYRQFAWQVPTEDKKVSNPVLDSQLLAERMQRLVSEILNGRGFREVARDKADFLVTYHTASRQQFRSSNVGVSVGVFSGWPHGYGTVFVDNPNDIRSYDQGVLMIDISDAASGKLVWRGWSYVPATQDQFRGDELYELVNRILSRFPPG